MRRHLAVMAARGSARLNRLIEGLAAIGIWLLVADVSIAVISRYAFSAPLSWAEEVARYLLIWVALLAISIGFAKGDHPGVDLLSERLPPRARDTLALIGAAVATVFFLVLIYFGVVFVARGANQSALSLGITLQLPHAAVPVGATISLVQIWLVTVARLCGRGRMEVAP